MIDDYSLRTHLSIESPDSDTNLLTFNIWMSTSPLIPPPSRHRTLSLCLQDDALSVSSVAMETPCLLAIKPIHIARNSS